MPLHFPPNGSTPRRMSGNTVFFFLILAAMIATVVALVRGIIAFLKTSEADLKAGGISAKGAPLRKAPGLRWRTAR